MNTTHAKITRAEYMENSHELFRAYYAQFVTEETRRFVAQHIIIQPGYLGSQSTHTCVGKEAARQLLEEQKLTTDEEATEEAQD